MEPRKSTENILKKYGIKPNKRLGQNFLADEDALEKIIEAAGIKNTDIVLEIGPGVGVLTCALAKKAKKVIAVEKDDRMCGVLLDKLLPYPNVQLVNEDILRFLPKFHEKEYKVIANIPYYLTSQLIRQLLERENQPQKIVLLVQKEVARRICSAPPDMSILAISVQFYGDPLIVAEVKKDSFIPEPKVDSAILKIENIKKDKYKTNKAKFFQIVKAGFSAKRKTLENALSAGLQRNKGEIAVFLNKLGIDPKQRAESLSIEQWIRIAAAFCFF